MDYQERNRRIANSYYNLGLEKARIRDLSGAAECLKKSIHFDKYQTDARNLLGLIYYECGEVADALIQWVISYNLKEKDNLANHYLDEVQRKPGQLEIESQSVKTFNQALWHAKNGSDDLAILQLARVVQARPHFVKAHLLLALLYMSRADFNKAGRSLYKILQIDKSNQKALYYMSIVKQNTGRADAERRRMMKLFSHRQMEDDDVILPNTYKEMTGLSTIICIIVGLAMGLAAFYLLLMPARERSLNHLRDEELTTYIQKLNTQNMENDRLSGENESLTVEAQALAEELAELKEGNTSILAQYQSLVEILALYRSGDLAGAAERFAGADFSLITDEQITAIVEDISVDMSENIYTSLVDYGLEVWGTGAKEKAMEIFQACLSLNPEAPDVMFYVARLYQDAGDIDNANTLFDKLVNEYSDSEYALRAETARGY